MWAHLTFVVFIATHPASHYVCLTFVANHMYLTCAHHNQLYLLAACACELALLLTPTTSTFPRKSVLSYHSRVCSMAKCPSIRDI